MGDFGSILDKKIFSGIDSDEYGRAAEKALEQLKQGRIPEDYSPYVTYLRLFADSYRVWQISYGYSQVRNGFKLAAHVLRQQLEQRFRDGLSREHRILLEAFEGLSRMLCEYTWCENSLITNDPFALLEHSKSALDLEDAALRILKTKQPFGDATLDRIRTWLAGYLKKNRLLHSGLNACADIYIRILSDHSCPAGLYRDRIKKAENSLRLLEKKSSELASELNAHVEHIKRHYQRTSSARRDFSYLTMKEGTVVLCMSGTCLIELARDAIEEEKGLFWEELKEAFKSLGIALDNEDRTDLKLQDVFQTSFGAHYLRSFMFKLPDTLLTFMNGTTYRFETDIVISAFGVCTVRFTLDISKKNSVVRNGSEESELPVEIIRALQSCICPHAGQAHIEIHLDRRPPDDRESQEVSPMDRLFIPRTPSAGLVNRLDVLGFLDVLSRIKALVNARPSGAFDDGFLKAIESIEDKTRNVVEETKDNPLPVDHLFKSVDNEEFADEFAEEFLSIWNTLHNYEKKSRSDEKEDPEASSIVLSLSAVSNSFNYLSDLAEYYLEGVDKALRSLRDKKPDPKQFLIPSVAKDSPDRNETKEDIALDYNYDTGWYAYVYARKIDLVPRRGRPKSVRFDEILNHPDTRGLIIEQREARASFDDWRFMHPLQKTYSDENLAYVRSHDTDAFFASEYQAFIFLPDDPRFLTDQYETTIELMIRLVSAIRFYSRAADASSYWMRKRYNDKERSSNLEEAYKGLRHLRSLSKELPILVSKVGISRYKDHGELMQRLVRNMKIDRIAGILEQHWENIDQMYSQRLREKQAEIQDRMEENARRSKRIIGILTFIVAAAALPGVAEHIADFNLSDPLSKGSIPTTIAFAVMLAFIIVVVWSYLRTGKQKPKIMNRKPRKNISVTPE